MTLLLSKILRHINGPNYNEHCECYGQIQLMEHLHRCVGVGCNGVTSQQLAIPSVGCTKIFTFGLYLNASREVLCIGNIKQEEEKMLSTFGRVPHILEWSMVVVDPKGGWCSASL